MSRSYSARLVALALHVDAKWLDNLLSRHHVPGVNRSRQGIERRISDDGLIAIEAVRMLNRELGVSLAQAAAIVESWPVSAAAGEFSYALPSGLELRFPIAEMERRLRRNVLEAIEAVARVPRGRPRRASQRSE